MTMATKLKSCLLKIAFVFTFPSALLSPMGEVNLSEDERQRLDTNFVDTIWQSGFSKSFLVWRRRLLYSASVFLTIGAVIQISDIKNQCGGFLADTYDEDQGAYVTDTGEDVMNYTALGKAALASQRAAPFCSLAVVLLAAWFWTDYNRSRNVLVPGWLLTLLLSLWPMIIPLKYILKDYTLAQTALLGATYAFGVLPTYLSIIAGLMLGSKRVFMFAPSPLSGAMLVLGSVFAIIIPFASLTLISQLVGDYLLVAGICLLVIAPVIIVFYASKFTAVTAFGSNEHIQTCQRVILVSGLCRGAGLCVILAWLIQQAIWAYNYSGTAGEDLTMVAEYIVSLVDFEGIAGMVLEFIGGMMFNAVLWTDIVVHVSRNDTVKMQKLQSDLG